MVSEGSLEAKLPINLQRSAPRHCSQCVGQVHTKDLRDASHVTLQGDQEAGGLIPRPAKTRLGTRGFWNTTQGTSQQRMASKLLEKYANRNRFHNSNGVQLDLNPFVHIRYTMGQLKKKPPCFPIGEEMRAHLVSPHLPKSLVASKPSISGVSKKPMCIRMVLPKAAFRSRKLMPSWCSKAPLVILS